MIDINFYQKIAHLKERLVLGEKISKSCLFDILETARSEHPVVYNIEPTNRCPMKCEMCPRTTMMTRELVDLDVGTIRKVMEQLRPWTEKEWSDWGDFATRYYGIKEDEMSENHFFLYIIPKVIQFHSYGEILIDKFAPDKIKCATDNNMLSYFSSNPALINNRTIDIFEEGLDYIKFSIESVNDKTHKKIRGSASDFTKSYKKIMKLINEKDKRGLNTTIVITMLDLKREGQIEDFEKLKEKFSGTDVYIYLKSQDQQWYQNKNEGTKSIHWTEFCQFPWSSMTIKSNGESCQCVEDFNNEIVLGDVRKESLYDIWNGQKYKAFRLWHFNMKKKIKCTSQCDMKLIGEYCAK